MPKSVCDLSTFIVITNADGSLFAKSFGPETSEGWLIGTHAIMGEDKPKSKDRLGEDVKDSVGDDFLVEIGNTTTIGNTPNTRFCQYRRGRIGERPLTLDRRSRG